MRKLKKYLLTKQNSGSKMFAVIVSALFGDIALPFWRGCGFGPTISIIFILFFSTTVFFGFFGFYKLIIIESLDFLNWPWIETKKEVIELHLNTADTKSLIASFLSGLWPEFIGIAFRFPLICWATIMPILNALQILLPMLLASWLRLIVVNLILHKTKLTFSLKKGNN